MKNELDYSRLTTQQLLVNKACLEDTLSIQVKCSGMLTQLKEYVVNAKGTDADPTDRMNDLMAILAQQKAEAKKYKDRLYFWDRQEQLIGITHETVEIVSRMVSRVNDVLVEIEAEISLLATLSKTFFELLDAVETAFPDEYPQGASEDRFELLQNAPSSKTLQ